MKKSLLSLKSKFRGNELVSSFFIFLFFLLINGITYFSVRSVSSIDDQWFYFKIADLIRSGGISSMQNFQAAFFTDLSQSGYSYGAGLYHFFLIPFTLFSNKIIGLKLSGLFFASLVPTIIYAVLSNLKVKGKFLFVVAFLYVLRIILKIYLQRPF